MDETTEATIFEDFANLEQHLTEDTSGNKARIYMEYFKDVASVSEELLESATDADQIRQVQQLLHGFHAARRIIQGAWESIHNTVLPV